MDSKGRLNYRVLGKGHPVVFLHGFLESSTMWSFLDLDKAPFCSILIDLPGHGGSELLDDTEEPSVLYMAGEVKRTLEGIGVQNYSVVGHSMGGYVALHLKLIDQQCNKVVLLNSNFWEDPEEKKRDRVRVADIVFRSKDLFIQEAIPGLFYRHERKDPVINALVDEAKQMEPIGIAYASLAMRNRTKRTDVISRNPHDFLIIQGLNDPLIPKERMEMELVGLNVKTVILSESGHMAHIEQPAETLAALTDFLQ